MSFKYALAALCLALGISAIPDGKSILGYRTVNPDEAAKINANGAPVWEGRDYGGGKQLGPGVYTSPIAGQWEGDPGDWFCVIYVDSNQLNDVSKIWIPETYVPDPVFYPDDSIELWWSEDDEIPDYVQWWEDSWNPATTLYMAYISDFGTDLQLLIPPALVAPSGALGLSATCVQSVGALPDSATVDYDSWQNNIGGDRGQPDS